MIENVLTELERGVYAALETYSNVHRGTGHNSMVSTELFEHARDIVLDYLKLEKANYTVIFCTPIREEILKTQLKPSSMHIISSKDIGLPLGIRAIAVEKKALPKGVPFHTGGGAVKHVLFKSVVWADPPDKFEAGTPNIVNSIALAKALQLIKHFGNDAFHLTQEQVDGASSANEILYKDEFLKYTGKELLIKIRKALIGRDIRVPTIEGERSYINLDNGASTPTFSPIWEMVCQTLRQPENVRQEIVREVKKLCAEFLGAHLEEYDVILTSNTTEAINIAAQNESINIATQNLSNNSEEAIEPVIVNTILEHNSNELPWRYIHSASIIRLEVDDEGFVDLNKLETLLQDYNQKRKHNKKWVHIVAICGASNVLGSFNDIKAISRIAHKYGARLLVDGAQLVAHRKVSIAESEIDYFAFSGHKMYAPFGSGALVVRKRLLNFKPAELTKIKLSGEENVVGIAAMGKAFVILERIGMDVIETQERSLTRRALNGLSRIPGIEIFGVQGENSPRFNSKGGVIVFSLTRVPHNLAAKELAEYGGIGVRNGCFCAHLLVRYILKINPIRAFVAKIGAMLIPGPTSKTLPGLVRVSFGIENDENEVKHLIHILKRIVREPRPFIERFLGYSYNGTPVLHHTEIEEKMKEFTEVSMKRVFLLQNQEMIKS